MPVAVKRRTGIVLLIVAVCLLAVGALAFTYARAAHGEAQQMLASAEEAQQQAQARQAAAQRNRALVATAERVVQRADAAGIAPVKWSERHVSLRQQSLQRSDANQILAGTARHAGQVMKLEEFELSVTHADEGLFDTPKNARQPVLLTLRGMMYFRLGQ